MEALSPCSLGGFSGRQTESARLLYGHGPLRPGMAARNGGPEWQPGMAARNGSPEWRPPAAEHPRMSAAPARLPARQKGIIAISKALGGPSASMRPGKTSGQSGITRAA